MKSQLIAATLTGLVLASSALAYSPNAPASTPAPRPVPSSVVKPVDLPPSCAGSVVNIRFTLDQAGQPRDIELLGVDNAVLKRQLVKAFSQWRFEPGVTDAAGAKKHYILPLELLPEV